MDALSTAGLSTASMQASVATMMIPVILTLNIPNPAFIWEKIFVRAKTPKPTTAINAIPRLKSIFEIASISGSITVSLVGYNVQVKGPRNAVPESEANDLNRLLAGNTIRSASISARL